MTSAQRYNAKMDKLFEDAKVNLTKHAPLHAVQMLEQLTAKVESIMRNGNANFTEKDMSELNNIARRSRSVLDALHPKFEVSMVKKDLANVIYNALQNE